MSGMTPQHPAALETETDANGLTEGERQSLNVAVDEAETCVCCGGDYGFTHVYAAVERIVAERVRVVEGERDAARAREDYVGTEHVRLEEAYGVQADLLAEAIARAESAEAAHEAEKAAHERLRAVLNGRHGGLHWCYTEDQQPEVYEPGGRFWPCPTGALLGGGEAR